MITPARQSFTVATKALGPNGNWLWLRTTGMKGMSAIEVICRYASHLTALGFTQIQTVTAQPISTLKLN